MTTRPLTRDEGPSASYEPRSMCRGPKGHINIRTSDSGSKTQYEGDTRNQFCRILIVMCSLGAPIVPVRPEDMDLI